MSDQRPICNGLIVSTVFVHGMETITQRVSDIEMIIDILLTV